MHEADKVSLGAAAATVLRAGGWRLSGLGPEHVRARRPKKALKRELGKLGRGTRKKRRAQTRETRPTPLGGDEFQDEFAHMKKNKQRQDEFGSIR